MKHVVFIDRDGVINKDLWKYVEHWDEFEFLPGVLDAFKLLHEHKYLVVIISNQAGIAQGIFTKEALENISHNMKEQIRLHGGHVHSDFYCIHGKEEKCPCRKPEPGLLENASQNLPPFKKDETFFIGDKISDIQAGKAFGIKTIMVETGYGLKEKHLAINENTPDFFAQDLYDAVTKILSLKTAP